MQKLHFTKMVAAGNDFVILDSHVSCLIPHASLPKLARALCQRKTGIGADGLLVLERSRMADFKMRLFNADGSEAEMCGNGLRCVTIYAHKKNVKVETKAGIYEAVRTDSDRVKIKMGEPKDFKLAISINVHRRQIKVNYIHTGVPHTVIFVQGLKKIDVEHIGRSIREHRKFKPKGTNVDFVELIDDKNIKMRTYERGVEGETLACGTGAVASAVISQSTVHSPQSIVHSQSFASAQDRQYTVDVHTKGGVLRVYFRNAGGKIKDVYLEGEAREVFTGVLQKSF